MSDGRKVKERSREPPAPKRRGYERLDPEDHERLHHPPERHVGKREIHRAGGIQLARPVGRPGEGSPKPQGGVAMAKDFPTSGAFGVTPEAYPGGSGAFMPKVVPMAPAGGGEPKTPWLRPVSTPPQGLPED